MTVGEVGEFGLIAKIAARLTRGPNTLLGPGDDAALLRAADGRVVATMDLLLEGEHFRREWAPAHDIGRRAAAANLADVAAMGAEATALLVGFGTPPELPLKWAEELTDGLREECDLVAADVVGGDVVRSDRILLAITALGSLGGREPVRRAGARPGDVVALAGRIGWAAGGLAVLQRGFRSPAALVAAYRRPQPPYSAGPAAATAGATAMCDVSDGLLADLGHLASASGVSMDVRRDRLPVPEPLRDIGAALGADPYRWILTGGEDHALAATFPRDVALPEPFSAIGEVSEGDGVTVDGAVFEDAGGFDHFRGGRHHAR